MPIDYADYPDNWKTEIRPAVLRRAGGDADNPAIGAKCEECGVENYAEGMRSLDGTFFEAQLINGMKSDRGIALFGWDAKEIKIVLTISHTDHDINNNEMENLKALCQRCHLRHDAPFHAANRRRNKAKKAGQMFLFEGV